jgi:hypothetical protein
MRKTVLLVSALALLACSNRDFNKPETLDQPRILAIQAEPPQPKLGEATTLRPLVYLPPGDPGENATYHWKWCPLPTTSSNAYKCPVDQTAFDQVYASLGLGVAPSLDLADGDPSKGQATTFTNPFPAAMLAELCTNPFAFAPGAATAGASAAVDGGSSSQTVRDCLILGFPITIYLTIDSTSGGKLDAVYVVNLPTDDNRPGNQNPVVGGIQATWRDAPDGGASASDDGASASDGRASASDGGTSDDGGGAQPLDASPTTIDADDGALDAGQVVDAASPSGTVDAAGIVVGSPNGKNGVVLDDAYTTLLPRQEYIALHLLLPTEAAEALTPAQSNAESLAQASLGTTTPTRIVLNEDLNLAWFAEAGDFGANDRGGHNTHFLGFPEDPNSLFIDAINNTWTLPKTENYKGKTSRIIVVVRDNRGGVTWTMATASLETSP